MSIARNMEKGESRGRRLCALHDIELAATGECDECSRLLAVGHLMTVAVFEDGDDDGYRDWVTIHRGGYVINIQKTYNPSDVILHQATCQTINGEPARGDVFVGDHVKVCSTRRGELDDWAIRTVGTSLPQCAICF